MDYELIFWIVAAIAAYAGLAIAIKLHDRSNSYVDLEEWQK